ncbi:MAG: peptidoglycan DD-metalloendopeptidase family protein [Nitrospinae bacterium]|nr:peptidoglycan DD-metalloendopeptidase family protein [Nitrospinota bacterium]MBL7019921.1 peptidoglycan DD-metalloendopeptidase family protein [Nitrospinaceae bacterium]
MRHASLFLTVSVLAGLFFASAGWAEKKSAKEINVLLQDEQKELSLLKKKIANQDKLISSAGKKEGQLLSNLRKVDNQIKLKERELKIYQWNFLINKKKLAKLEKNLKTKTQKLKVQKLLLGKRFRQIYKEGPVFFLKIAFSSVNANEFLQHLKYMELIAQHDASLMADYKNQLDGMKTEKQSLLSVRAKLVRLEKNALSMRGEFENARKDKKLFLKKIKKKKQFGIQTRKELKKASSNLNDLIAKLLSKLVSGEGLNILDKRGRLTLPVKGRILNKFGRQKDKQYGSFIVHNGINIKARTGTSVRSIFNGKVLYTGDLEGYGNLVIIGHGKDYHSLYGHLDQIDVKPNQVVQAGDIIGLSGDTGSLIGETLYLEMREKGKPIEPIRWFKTARRK